MAITTPDYSLQHVMKLSYQNPDIHYSFTYLLFIYVFTIHFCIYFSFSYLLFITLCTMHYALCILHYVLCTMHYAILLFTIYYSLLLFTIYYLLFIRIHYFICIYMYSLFHVEIRRNPVILVPTRSSRRVE